MDPGLAPELSLARIQAAQGEGVVERERVARNQARADVGRACQTRRRIGEARVSDRHEVPGVGRNRHRSEHERHAVDEQRLGDAVDEAFAQAQQVEIAVEVAREADERAAIVVAIAVVDPVKRRLDGVLHGARQQDDDERRQQRDDGVVLVGVLSGTPRSQA